MPKKVTRNFVPGAVASVNVLGISFTVPSGAGMQADVNAAINILARLHGDNQHRWLPLTKVKQILLKRCRRPDETAHPGLQLQLGF